MFKLTESDNLVRCLSAVSIEHHETVPANTTIPRGHRFWETYEAWLAQGNQPEPYETDEERLNRLSNEARSQRDVLLKQTDYLVMPDYPNKPEGVETYRQALRDITSQTGFPESVDWPENPMENNK